MKCIASQLYPTEIYRVSNEHAEKLVDAGKAVYVPKSLWKKEKRDVKKSISEVKNA